MRRFALTSSLSLAAVVLLAGCSVSASANLTVPASQLASEAAAVLQEQVGSPQAPEIDCGDDQIDLVEGTTVDCVLTDPVSGTEYDTEIVVTEVDGTDYSFDTQVADTPRG